MDRRELRRQVRRIHNRWSVVDGKGDFRCLCPWCGLRLASSEGDLHEAFIKRSAVAKRNQDAIFVEENCVLVHHHCHSEFGQTGEMRRRCFQYMRMAGMEDQVVEWYASMTDVNGNVKEILE